MITGGKKGKTGDPKSKNTKVSYSFLTYFLSKYNLLEIRNNLSKHDT